MSDIEVRPSSVEGLGIFARRAFAAGDRIARVNVVREITPEAPIRADLGERIEHCAYPDGRVVLIGFPERHVNHSCDPNAYELYERDGACLVARRDIMPGSEITIDYNVNITNGTAWPCRCGARRCRGEVAGDFFALPPEWQREYRPLLAEWFLRRHRSRIEAEQASTDDRSNGWEAVAKEFMETRARASVGAATVQAWARSLPRGGSVLDLGCGSGVPISEVLIDQGLAVCGIDASPTLAEAFRRRFPNAPIACEAVEESAFFRRTFDGAVAWGLMFLLPPATQRDVIVRVARVLNSGGRFLFTAPAQACSWTDQSTGRTSISLGADAYTAALAEAGLSTCGEYVDEGENHYYDAVKP